MGNRETFFRQTWKNKEFLKRVCLGKESYDPFYIGCSGAGGNWPKRRSRGCV